MLLDSNLIIYASQPKHESLRAFIAREAPHVSVISKVETLGYHRLSQREQQFLSAFFDAAQVLPVSQSVVGAAIRLRKERSVSLGDALIAGTALAYDLPLATHNTSDFAWIDELRLLDPLSEDR